MQQPSQRRAWRWAAAVTTGLALNAVQGLEPVWPGAWIAPLPLLWAVLTAPGLRSAFALSLAAALVGLVSTAAYYAAAAADAPAGLRIIVVAVFTLPRAIPLVAMMTLCRLVVGDGRHWLAPLAFSASAAAADLLLTRLSPNGVLASWANSQAAFLPAIQVLALGGMPAAVFLLTLPASALGVALARPAASGPPRWAYLLPAALLALGLGYGAARLAAPPAAAHLRVGLLAGPRREGPPIATGGGPADAVLSAYLAATPALSAQGARIVVIPEKVEALDPAGADRAKATLSAWAATHRQPLLIGFDVARPAGQRWNRAWLFDAAGVLRADYAKHHLVPLVERAFASGKAVAVVEIDGGPIGIAICKDMDFPGLPRDIARAGARALIVPAWDFDVDAAWHARMAVLRGVEQGLGIARSANNGLMTVSDPYGRILAHAPAGGRAAPRSLVADLPLGGAGTLYGRWGDVAGWACVLAASLALVQRPLMRLRRPPSGP